MTGTLKLIQNNNFPALKKGVEGIGELRKGRIGLTNKSLQGHGRVTALGAAAIIVGSDLKPECHRCRPFQAIGEDLKTEK